MSDICQPENRRKRKTRNRRLKMMMRLNQPPIEIYIINRIYGSCATPWYCCALCFSKVVVRISLSIAPHEASVLYRYEDQVKSPSSPKWEHKGEGFRIKYWRWKSGYNICRGTTNRLLVVAQSYTKKNFTNNEHNNEDWNELVKN